VVVRRLLDGHTFAEAHRELTDQYGFSPGGAFTIVMRVWRSGGLTKDAIYLRGLQELVEYMTRGRDLDFLWTGKLPLVDLPLAESLSNEGSLGRAAILPAFLHNEDARQRLKTVAANEGLRQLIGADT
jgi:hypothetical protein